MPAQEKLSQTEQYLAYLTGIGITLSIVALILIGLGTFDSNDIPISLLLVGLAMIVIGIGGWLYLARPWEKFDDLKTPLYTGHEEEHALPAAEASSAEAEAVEIPVTKTPEPAPVLKRAPEVVQTAPPAASAQLDDLTLIEGIGPKSAEALKAAGIATFAQLAKSTPGDLEKILKERKIRLVGSTEHWPRQAEIAATGDVTALDGYRKRKHGETVEDDLTLIEGIGPKSAEALKAAGIKTFAQVARMAPADLEKAVKDRKVRLVGNAGSWPAQAELAAKGDLTGLEALQLRLKGGADKG
jgi:predicted flap endonuclease-1-like 5' DNA nuclease